MLDQKDPRHQVDQRHWRLIGEWLEVQRHLIQTLPGFR